MAGRRLSARRLSVSRAAKQHLRNKKRKKKLGISREKPVSSKGLWILVIAALIVVGFVVARMVANGGFGRG